MNTAIYTCYLCGGRMDMRCSVLNRQTNDGRDYHYACEAEEYIADCEGREPVYEVEN